MLWLQVNWERMKIHTRCTHSLSAMFQTIQGEDCWVKFNENIATPQYYSHTSLSGGPRGTRENPCLKIWTHKFLVLNLSQNCCVSSSKPLTGNGNNFLSCKEDGAWVKIFSNPLRLLFLLLALEVIFICPYLSIYRNKSDVIFLCFYLFTLYRLTRSEWKRLLARRWMRMVMKWFWVSNAKQVAKNSWIDLEYQ